MITPVCSRLLGIIRPYFRKKMIPQEELYLFTKWISDQILIPTILQRTAVEAIYSRSYFRKGMIPQEELYFSQKGFQIKYLYFNII